MKNNKGYYNWIHDLKSAAHEVQANHAKLISEAQYNPTVSGESGLKTGKTRIHGGSKPGVVGQAADEQMAGNIALGLAGLVQTINTGKRPEFMKDVEGSGQGPKAAAKAPNPTLKPSEWINVNQRGIGNIAKAARAQAQAIGRGESPLGDEGFIGDIGDTPSPGPMAGPGSFKTLSAIERLRRMQTPNRTAKFDDATPDLSPRDVNGNGQIDGGDFPDTDDDGDVDGSDVASFRAEAEKNRVLRGPGYLGPEEKERNNALTRQAMATLRASQGMQTESVSDIINRMING